MWRLARFYLGRAGRGPGVAVCSPLLKHQSTSEKTRWVISFVVPIHGDPLRSLVSLSTAAFFIGHTAESNT